jgi:putative peptidoglycan lipid II flippase
VAALIIILRKKVGFLGGKRILKSYGKILLSSAVMGTIIYFLWHFLKKYAYINLWYFIVILLSIIIAGSGLYLLFTYMLKMEEIQFVLGLFKNLKRKKSAATGI